MKTTDELKEMLFERVAEINRGGLTRAYEDQLRYEIALLADILGDDIDAAQWEAIEAAM